MSTVKEYVRRRLKLGDELEVIWREAYQRDFLHLSVSWDYCVRLKRELEKEKESQIQ